MTRLHEINQQELRMSTKNSPRRVSRRSVLKNAGAAAIAGGASALLGGTAAAQRGAGQAPAIATKTQAGRSVRAFVKLDKTDIPSVQTIRLRALASQQVAVRTTAAQTCYSSVGQVLLPSPVAAQNISIVGHGGVGIVEAIGSDVVAVRPGDRVIVNFHSQCGYCYDCLRGRADQCLNSAAPLNPTADLDGKPVFSGNCGMTEIMVVNQEKCVPIFSDVSSEELAMLTCVGNCGLGMAMVRCPVEFGSDVVVFGAGPVGLSAIQGANIKGAARIIVVEPIRYRRELALKLGATDGLDPHQYNERTRIALGGTGAADLYRDALVEHIREMLKSKTDRTLAGGGKIGPDHIVEAAGGDMYGGVVTRPSAGGGPDPSGMTVLHQVWELCSRAGTAVSGSIGFPMDRMMEIPANQFADGAKHFWGGTCGGTNVRRDGPRYVRLMERGKLNMKVMAQKTYTLDQAREAYRVAMNREVVATIVKPNAT